ncbi:MAG TPA: DUF4190 domain-containing protein [Tepidisphaeraceae bacterium]
MSQMPPGGPPGYPPNYPPYVPPGMQMPGGYSMQPNVRTSGAAIASLVCGLILCIPFVTGLVAIITGIVGISTTGNPAVKGRGMAIAGLILGLINFGLWGAGGGAIAVAYQHAKPQRTLAKQYVSDLVAGNTDQCVQHSSVNLTRPQIEAYIKQAQAWGTMSDVTVFGFSVENNNGSFTGSINGVCKFGATAHAFSMTLVKESDEMKVDTFRWQ